MQNLALKYRPRSFGEVVGQDSAVKVLRKLVVSPDIRVLMLSGQHGIGKCVVGDTRFLSSNGWERIGAYDVGLDPGKYNSINLELSSFLGNGIAKEFYFNGVRPVVTLDLIDGSRISGLETHPLLCYTEEGFEWKTLGVLKNKPSGVFIVSIGRQIEEGEVYSLDVDRYLMGMGSRGYVSRNRLCVEGPLPYLHEVIEEFNLADAIVKRKTSALYILESKVLWNLVREKGVEESSHQKTIYRGGHDSVLLGSLSQIWSFLSGFWDGGFFNFRQIRSYDFNKLKLIKLMLLSFGINSQIRKTSGFTGWHLIIDHVSLMESGLKFGGINKDVNASFSYGSSIDLFTIPYSNSLQRVLKMYGHTLFKDKGLTRRELSRILEKDVELGLEDAAFINAVSKAQFLTVKMSSWGSPQPCYDFSVEDHENFLTEGLVSHNTTLARIYAKGISCTNFKSDVCGECDPCKAADGERLSDYSERDMGSSGTVDHIRKLQEEINFKPTWSCRVFTLDEVHSISKEAGNALLKTLEEPPAKAAFVLCTTELRRVPYAITSRCLLLELEPLNAEVVADRLLVISREENIKLERSAAVAISRAAHGSLRDALMILQRVAISADFDITLTSLGDEHWFVSQSKVVLLLKALISKDVELYNKVIGELTGRNSYTSMVQTALEKLCESAIVKGILGGKTSKLIDNFWKAYTRLKRGMDPVVVMKGLWVDDL